MENKIYLLLQRFEHYVQPLHTYTFCKTMQMNFLLKEPRSGNIMVMRRLSERLLSSPVTLIQELLSWIAMAKYISWTWVVCLAWLWSLGAWNQGILCPWFVQQGAHYWEFNEDTMEVVSTEPRPIASKWPGIPPNIEAAVRLRDGYIYFFKGIKWVQCISPHSWVSSDPHNPPLNCHGGYYVLPNASGFCFKYWAIENNIKAVSHPCWW